MAHGYRFYAVELRKYGYSLLEGQRPDFVRSMYEVLSGCDCVQIRDEIHDLFLSSRQVREEAFRVVFRWLGRTG